jgi:PmbA protein
MLLNNLEVTRSAVASALGKGAREAAAGVTRSRSVEVEWRDGKLEKIAEATTRSLGIQLYVDGRYASVSTSDLRPEALDRFMAEAVVMTRTLAADPYRSLPDPELYKGQPAVELQIEDPGYDHVTPQQRSGLAADLESAARTVKGAEAIISVSTRFSDGLTESWRVHSNGFEGVKRETSFAMSASVSVKDQDDRRPMEGHWGASRYFSDLPSSQEVGTRASHRALSRLGALKMASEKLPMVVENRVAGGLLGRLLGPLTASSLQQKRSFFEGRIGFPFGSKLLDVTDDPLLVKGLASRLFDGEGFASKRMPLFEQGVVRSVFVDNYYGRKLGLRPTTAGSSNLTWKLGNKDERGLLADVGEGVLVTGFLGGNSNGTTGDFSLGVQGFRVRRGQVAEPVGEMNIAGNHLEVWKQLAAVGNDPFPYASMRTPTLVFDGIQFAGV